MKLVLSILSVALAFAVGIFAEHDFNAVALTRQALVPERVYVKVLVPVANVSDSDSCCQCQQVRSDKDTCKCNCKGDSNKCTCARQDYRCCPCHKCGKNCKCNKRQLEAKMPYLQ